MKTAALLVLLFFANVSFAGPRVNNGGGSWVCRNLDGSVRWMQAQDLFFLYRDQSLSSFQKSGSAWAIYGERMNFISQHLKDLQALLERHPLDLRKAVKMYDIAIDVIGDGEVYYRPLRTTCAEGRIGYEQVADFLPGNQLVINKSLWAEKSFSETDKAAILLHERIYFALRAEDDDQTSWRTQLIVSALMSGKSTNEIESDVDEALSGNPRDKRAEDAVVLFPVELQCNASVSKLKKEGPSTSYEMLGADSWSAVSENDGYSQVLMNFRFTMVTNPNDGSPQILRIEDLDSGTSTELLNSMTKAVFMKNKIVSITLQRTQKGEQANLDCWTR